MSSITNLVQELPHEFLHELRLVGNVQKMSNLAGDRTESLGFCPWFRRLSTFYEIKTKGTSKHLYILIPIKNKTYDTCSTH